MKHEALFKKETGWLLEERYAGKLTQKAKRDIKKLKKGYPLAYLIGNQPFLNCNIDLKYKPLIPRPETEHWVGELIDNIKKQTTRIFRQGHYGPSSSIEVFKVLDMFSGSGCIGLAILKNTRTFDKTSKNLGLENLSVDFVDIKGKNLKQIKRNIRLNNITGNYKLIKSDIFTKIEGKYDCVVANPPYISSSDKDVQASVKKYEPKNALYSEGNGLEIIERFLSEVKKYLNENGQVHMEFGHNQKKDIIALLKKYKYENYKFCKDQYGKWRWVVIS